MTMSTNTPAALHPIAICEDRYSGVYAGGAWWAVARADERFQGVSRIAWLWENGPGAGDVDAAIFWRSPPPWIAFGPTPQVALDRLTAQEDAASDAWAPPRPEDDPRWSKGHFPPTRTR